MQLHLGLNSLTGHVVAVLYKRESPCTVCVCVCVVFCFDGKILYCMSVCCRRVLRSSSKSWISTRPKRRPRRRPASVPDGDDEGRRVAAAETAEQRRGRAAESPAPGLAAAGRAVAAADGPTPALTAYGRLRTAASVGRTTATARSTPTSSHAAARTLSPVDPRSPAPVL